MYRSHCSTPSVLVTVVPGSLLGARCSGQVSPSVAGLRGRGPASLGTGFASGWTMWSFDSMAANDISLKSEGRERGAFSCAL